MSSRMLIELVCDECAYVETFVHLERNQNGAVASVTIREAAERRGWTSVSPIDSRLMSLDYCAVCSEWRRAGRKPKQEAVL